MTRLVGIVHKLQMLKLNLTINRVFGQDFGQEHVAAARNIINNESGFNPGAINKSSGACGLGQALPCSKLPCPLSFKGVECQVQWVSNYIKGRYTNPLMAWAFWQENRWY